MIKNIEVAILKPNEIYSAENFNLEFSSISYYYFLKLRKNKIRKCSYIKIWIKNKDDKSPIRCELLDGILFIQLSLDFSNYLTLNNNEKLKFQYEMMYSIFKEAFVEYEVDLQILKEINEELSANNWKMKFELVKKEITKEKKFKLILNMDIDSFTFVGEVLDGREKKSFQIFKSIPTFFALDFLFNGYSITDNVLKIGSREKPTFALNLVTGKVTIVDNNEMVRRLKYKSFN